MQVQAMRMLLVSSGYACFLALNSFSLWGFAMLPQAALGIDAAPFWSVSLSICNAISFFGIACASAVKPRLVGDHIMGLTVVLFAAALALVGVFFVGGVFPVLIAGGAAMGIATTCCFFCWARLFYCEGVAASKLEIVLGSVLSAVPFFAFLTLNPSALLGTLAVLVLVTVGILMFLNKGFSKDEVCVYGYSDGTAGLSVIFRILWRSYLCCLIIGVMASVVSAFTDVVLGEMSIAEQALMVHSENIIAALAVGIAWMGFQRRADMAKAFTVVFPILITLFLAFLIIPHIRIAVPFASGIVFVVCSMIVLVESISASKERGLNFGITYGVYAGILYTANASGSLALSGVVGKVALSESSMMLIVVALLYACSIVMFFVMRRPHSYELQIDGEGQRTEVSVCHAEEAPETSSLFEKTLDTTEGKAREIAQKKGLSERQTEVLILLSQGYTIPAVASSLYLSENTVRTHSKKLYAILGVHSKQELIELVHDVPTAAIEK